jgi:integrase
MVKTVLEKAERDGDYVVNLSPVAIGKRFTRILEKCNVGHFRFHDLRHYCVSVMLSLNIPKSYIAAYVGHETENMIDKVYGHIMASKKTSVEDQLQQYFEDILAK